jgi:hypothetical protein
METVNTNNPTAGRFHNYGYEHLKSIYRLKEAQARAPLQAASMYVLPLLALQSARSAIDEYVDLTGRKVDPAWDKIDRKTTPIQERIASIFGKTGQLPSFESDTWAEVLALFETAHLLKGDLTEMQQLHRDEIPEEFKDIAVEYPIYRSLAIAEQAIELLLEQPNINNPLGTNNALKE